MGLSGALTSAADRRTWQWWTLIVIAVLSAVFSLCCVLAKRSYEKYERAQKAAEAQQVHDRWLTIVRDRIGILLAQVGKVAATDDPKERATLAAVARTAIMTLASADAVGTRDGGVRMNLFQLSEDRSRMTPVPVFGSAGREDVSTRIFTLDDETMIATLDGKSRFIENTYEELGEEEANQLAYETFATSPVGSANGTIWGVLTVDAPKTGDLVAERDMPLMNIFAGLIAITYACERYPKPRR